MRGDLNALVSDCEWDCVSNYSATVCSYTCVVLCM